MFKMMFPQFTLNSPVLHHQVEHVTAGGTCPWLGTVALVTWLEFNNNCYFLASN